MAEGDIGMAEGSNFKAGCGVKEMKVANYRQSKLDSYPPG